MVWVWRRLREEVEVVVIGICCRFELWVGQSMGLGYACDSFLLENVE